MGTGPAESPVRHFPCRVRDELWLKILVCDFGDTQPEQPFMLSVAGDRPAVNFAEHGVERICVVIFHLDLSLLTLLSRSQ